MRRLCFFIFLVLCGCKGKIHSDNNHAFSGTVEFIPSEKVFISESVDSIVYLKLENSDSAFISRIHKVRFKNDKIFIGDFSQNKIIVYDTSGTFLYALNKRGRGPEEYLEIKSYCVDSSNVYVVDNMKRKLHIYDSRNGKFLKNRDLPFVAWDMEVLGEDAFVFCFSPFYKGGLKYEQPNYKLFVTDTNLHIINQYFPYTEDDFDLIGKDTYFTLNGDDVIYNWCMSDECYVISPAKPDCLDTIHFDFGDKKIPKSLKQNKQVLESDEYRYMDGTPVFTGNYIAMEISEGDYCDCYLYDRQTKQVLRNSLNSSFNCLLYPDGTDTQGRFVYILRNKEIYDELVADGFIKASVEIEQHLEDGLAIVFYIMKCP